MAAGGRLASQPNCHLPTSRSVAVKELRVQNTCDSCDVEHATRPTITKIAVSPSIPLARRGCAWPVPLLHGIG
jgi:hypothetical protein